MKWFVGWFAFNLLAIQVKRPLAYINASYVLISI